MARAKLTSKGQVTIPKEIRMRLAIGTGDTIDFIVRADGTVVVVPVAVDLKDLEGILAAKTRRRATVEEMHRAVRKRAGEYRR